MVKTIVEVLHPNKEIKLKLIFKTFTKQFKYFKEDLYKFIKN